MRIMKSVLLMGALAFSGNAIAEDVNYLNPKELAQFTDYYSYGAITQPSLDLIEFDRITSADENGVFAGGDIYGQLEAAIKKLDEALRSSGASKDDIVKLNLYYKGNSSDLTFALCEMLIQYYGRGSAQPVSSIVGVNALENDDAMIALDVTIKAPAKSAKIGKAANAILQVGGISAFQADFTIQGYGNHADELKAAFQNLDVVLAQGNSSADAVENLKIWVVGDSYDEAAIQRQITDYVGGEQRAEGVSIEIELVAMACVQGVGILLEADAVVASSD